MRLEVAYCGLCGTDLHIAHGAMDARVRPPQVIGHEMSGTVAEVGAESTLPAGDQVVVRPLDPRGETPADRGLSHISRDLRFLGIDAPGALQRSWTVPAFTLHALPAPSTSVWARSPSRSRWPATTSAAARCRQVRRRSSSAAGRSAF